MPAMPTRSGIHEMGPIDSPKACVPPPLEVTTPGGGGKPTPGGSREGGWVRAAESPLGHGQTFFFNGRRPGWKTFSRGFGRFWMVSGWTPPLGGKVLSGWVLEKSGLMGLGPGKIMTPGSLSESMGETFLEQCSLGPPFT